MHIHVGKITKKQLKETEINVAGEENSIPINDIIFLPTTWEKQQIYKIKKI